MCTIRIVINILSLLSLSLSYRLISLSLCKRWMWMVKFSATVGQNMKFVTQIVSFRCDLTRFTWTILDLGFDKSFPRFLQRQIRKIQLTYGSKMIQGPSEAFFFRAMILGASRVSKIGPEISGVQILTTDPSAGMPWIPTRSHQRASWLKRGWIPENNTILENTINHGTVRFLL